MDYNNFTSNTFDAKTTEKKLVNVSYLNQKLKTLATTTTKNPPPKKQKQNKKKKKKKKKKNRNKS